MANIDELTKSFKTRFDAFSDKCDLLETGDKWDLEEYGDMDVFFLSELVSIILKIIIADGVVSEKETEAMNKNFGFTYTVEELKEVYGNCESALNDSFDNRIRDDIRLLGEANGELVAEFKEITKMICEIISASDDFVADEESAEIKSITEIIKA